MGEAVSRFESQFPSEMQVDAGTPVMVYYVNFPGTASQAGRSEAGTLIRRGRAK
jgi:hypothetical protein